MITVVYAFGIVVAATALTIQFYKWVRRAQSTLDDDPFNEHFDWDEWERQQDEFAAQRTLNIEPAPVVTRKRVKATAKKTTTKKAPVKKASAKKTTKKVTRG